MHAYGDFFCELYDELDEAEFAANIEAWSADRFLQSAAGAVAQEIREGASVEQLRHRLDGAVGVEERRLALLMGLDKAFAHVNPALQGNEPVPASLAGLACEVVASGRLDSDSGHHQGALLLRYVWPRAGSNLPEHPREAFQSVIRVPGNSWRASQHIVLGPAAALWRRELEPAVKLACVPFVEHQREMRFQVEHRPAGRFYRIAPRSDLAAQGRVSRVLAAIDACRATIAVLPELTLSPALLTSWQEALRAPERRGCALRWLLIGTGNLRASGRPTNTAVLLDGRTGDLIASQRKLFRFNMTPEILVRWGLAGLLGDEHVDEDIECGRLLSVIEAGAMRVGILICEDLARVAALAALVRDHGLSHLLVPVFARGLREHRWEHARGEVHREASGANVLISNSMLIQSDEAKGTAMLLAAAESRVLLGAASDPAEPVCFLLEPDGSASLA